MNITHMMCRCINCGEALEIFDDDVRKGDVECFICNYVNELGDIRLQRWEESGSRNVAALDAMRYNKESELEIYYGLYICLSSDEIHRIQRASAILNAKDNAEVAIFYNGELRRFTFNDFYKRLGFGGKDG